MSDTAETYLNSLRALGDRISVTLSGEPRSLEEGLTRWTEELDRLTNSENKAILFGNGGSAAIAGHFAADWTKNLRLPALNFGDGPLLTCISNDLGYENVYSVPVGQFARPRDLVCAISSSGESENIVRAADAARARDCWVVTLSGFADTNRLRSVGDLNFYVPSPSYGFVEVLHMTLLQCVTDRCLDSRTNEGARESGSGTSSD